MSNRLMIIIAAIVVAGGAAAFVTMNNDDSPASSSSSSQSSTQTQQKESSDSKTKSNLSTIARDGKAVECDFSSSGASGTATGKMFSDGKGRGLMTINGTTEQGNSGVSNILTTADKSYSWTDSEGRTIGIMFDNAQLQSGTQAAQSNQAAGNINQDFDMDCKDWDVDESKLTPPTNINFQSLPTSIPGV